MKYFLALTLVLSFSASAFANRQNVSTSSGKAVVAHSRMAPVAVHRALPPYGLGKHVYRGR